MRKDRIAFSARKVDWLLLLFLLLLTNQAMIVLKFGALVLIYLLRPDFRFGLARGRLPLFYLLMPVLGGINLLVHVRDFSVNYLSTFSISVAFWLACLLAAHQVKRSIETKGPTVVHNTLKVWVYANAAATLIQLVRICLLTCKLNPYVGLEFPFGMSTGDNIFGTLFENSYLNLIVNAMLAIYFLFRGELFPALIATIVLTLVLGNAGSAIYLAVLAMIWLVKLLTALTTKRNLLLRFVPGKAGLWQVPVLASCAIGLSMLLSTQNFRYATTERPGVQETELRKTESTVIHLRKAIKELNFSKYEHPAAPAIDSADLPLRRRLALGVLDQVDAKKFSVLQTVYYSISSVQTAILGAGPGRFSSLTAQRVAGLDQSRLFRMLPHYESWPYGENHLMLVRYRINADPRQFSTFNQPDSFYNQLLGEYGLAGVLLFLLFYVGHCLRDAGKRRYGWWLGMLMVPFAILSYLFETLCPMVFFDLLMAQDIALTANQDQHSGT